MSSPRPTSAPMVGGRDVVVLTNFVRPGRLDKAIMIGTASVGAVMAAQALWRGGENRVWTTGFLVLIVLVTVPMTRSQRLEWHGDGPVLVNRAVGGWERRFALGPDAQAHVRVDMDRVWLGATRGRRRIWVQVLARDGDPKSWVSSAARDAEQMRALAEALAVCDGGPEVAALVRMHLTAMKFMPPDDSPLWEGPKRLKNNASTTWRKKR